MRHFLSCNLGAVGFLHSESTNLGTSPRIAACRCSHLADATLPVTRGHVVIDSSKLARCVGLWTVWLLSTSIFNMLVAARVQKITSPRRLSSLGAGTFSKTVKSKQNRSENLWLWEHSESHTFRKSSGKSIARAAEMSQEDVHLRFKRMSGYRLNFCGFCRHSLQWMGLRKCLPSKLHKQMH